jgi:hypothetical protein
MDTQLTAKEIILWALNKLADCLSPFVEQQFKLKGIPFESTSDPYKLLNAIVRQYDEVFQDVLGRLEKTWAHELLEYRNSISRTEQLTEEDTERALDTAYRLAKALKCDSVGAEMYNSLNAIKDRTPNNVPPNNPSEAITLRPHGNSSESHIADVILKRARANYLGSDDYYFQFWADMLASAKKAGIYQGNLEPRKVNWFSFPSGLSDFSYIITLARWNINRVELHINSLYGTKLQNETYFTELFKEKEAIENELQLELIWDKMEHARACRIAAWQQSTNRFTEREHLLDWTVHTFSRMKDVFGPRIRLIAKNKQVTNPRESGDFYNLFWTDVLRRANKRRLYQGNHQPRGVNWLSLPSGHSGFSYYIILAKWNIIRVELHINSSNRHKQQNEKCFKALLKDKSAIENELQCELVWDIKEHAQACHIAAEQKYANREIEREHLIEWSLDTLSRMKKAFGPRIWSLTEKAKGTSRGISKPGYKGISDVRKLQKRYPSYKTYSEKAVSSGSGAFYLMFWDDILECMLAEGIVRTRQTTRPQSYLRLSAGVAGYSYYLAFAHHDTFRVELHIDHNDQLLNKRVFRELRKHQKVIEARLGLPLSWQKLENKRSCRIAIFRTVSDRDAERLKLIKWGIKMFVKLRDVFDPLIREQARLKR